MEQESTYVGIDVAKAQVDVAVRPTGVSLQWGRVQENGLCNEVDKTGHFVAETGGETPPTGEEK